MYDYGRVSTAAEKSHPPRPFEMGPDFNTSTFPSRQGIVAVPQRSHLRASADICVAGIRSSDVRKVK